MNPRRLLTYAFEALVVVAVLALLVGQVTGTPILLSFVETGSMQPTLDPGDGFVAVPAAVAGPVEEGDVVVFRAEEIQGGGLTTHRVVDRADEGWITKGDANPFLDQNGGEPPVKDAQIVAKALQVGGHVVVIPHLGTAVTGTQQVLATVQRTTASLLGTDAVLGVRGLAYLFFGATLLVYVLDVLRERESSRTERSRTRDSGLDPRIVVGAFAVLLVVAATASMTMPAGTQRFGVVSAEFDSDRPDVIRMGTSTDRTYTVPNGGYLPVVVFLEPASDGIAVESDQLSVAGRSRVNTTVTLSVPPRTGYYRRFLVEHRYLAILPTPAIRSLYELHPWAPIVAIDALIGIPFYLVGVSLAGTGRVRSRRRNAPGSFRARLRSLLP